MALFVSFIAYVLSIYDESLSTDPLQLLFATRRRVKNKTLNSRPRSSSVDCAMVLAEKAEGGETKGRILGSGVRF